MGLNCCKTTKPLNEGGLLFTSNSPGVTGTHLIYPGRIKT